MLYSITPRAAYHTIKLKPDLLQHSVFYSGKPNTQRRLTVTSKSSLSMLIFSRCIENDWGRIKQLLIARSSPLYWILLKSQYQISGHLYSVYMLKTIYFNYCMYCVRKCQIDFHFGVLAAVIFAVPFMYFILSYIIILELCEILF